MHMSRDTFDARRTPGAGTRVTVAAAAGCLLAAGLALTGCSSAASPGGAGAATPAGTATAAAATTSSPAAATASLMSVPFPVAVGNTWTFKVTTSLGDGTTVSKMSAVVPVSDGQQVTMTSTNDIDGSTTSTSETYVFRPDGSILYPLSQFDSSGSGVTVSGSGIVWPPAATIDSGKPSTSELKLSIDADGQKIATTAHITVQGAGTQTVTVPAGTYQATVVDMTEAISVEGVEATVEVTTWLAPGVGPVKDEVLTDEAGTSHVTATEELESFTKG